MNKSANSNSAYYNKSIKVWFLYALYALIGIFGIEIVKYFARIKNIKF